MKENGKTFDYTFKPKAYGECVDVEDLNIIEKHYIFKNERFIEVQKNGDKFELKRVEDGIELVHFRPNLVIERTLVYGDKKNLSSKEDYSIIAEVDYERLINTDGDVIAEGYRIFEYKTFWFNEMSPGDVGEIIYKDDLTKEYCGKWFYAFDNLDILIKEETESWLLFQSETDKVIGVKKEEFNELVEIYWATMNNLCAADVDHGFISVVEEMRSNGNFTEEWVAEILDELVG